MLFDYSTLNDFEMLQFPGADLTDQLMKIPV